VAGPEAQVVRQAGASQASGGGGPGHNGKALGVWRWACGGEWPGWLQRGMNMAY